jgi:hypothetical protein
MKNWRVTLRRFLSVPSKFTAICLVIAGVHVACPAVRAQDEKLDHTLREAVHSVRVTAAVVFQTE